MLRLESLNVNESETTQFPRTQVNPRNILSPNASSASQGRHPFTASAVTNAMPAPGPPPSPTIHASPILISQQPAAAALAPSQTQASLEKLEIDFLIHPLPDTLHEDNVSQNYESPVNGYSRKDAPRNRPESASKVQSHVFMGSATLHDTNTNISPLQSNDTAQVKAGVVLVNEGSARADAHPGHSIAHPQTVPLGLFPHMVTGFSPNEQNYAPERRYVYTSDDFDSSHPGTIRSPQVPRHFAVGSNSAHAVHDFAIHEPASEEMEWANSIRIHKGSGNPQVYRNVNPEHPFFDLFRPETPVPTIPTSQGLHKVSTWPPIVWSDQMQALDSGQHMAEQTTSRRPARILPRPRPRTALPPQLYWRDHIPRDGPRHDL